MADQPDVTTVAGVAGWLKMADDDVQLVDAYKSAEGYVRVRCTWPAPADGDAWAPAPDDLVQAVRLLTARYLARRNSPDGFVGMGEFGPARVTVTDRDIDRCMAPWRRVVLA